MKSTLNNISIYRFFINLFFIFYLSFFNLSYSQSQFESNPQKSSLLPEISKVSENIVYKTSKKGNPLSLDIYSPVNASGEKVPVVIYVHGGAWVKGDKTIKDGNYIEIFISKLLDKKYAVISINYTLLNDSIHFPLPLEDTKDAVRWVRKNAARYNFDPNNIGFFGASSGAHLSMLAAYTPDNQFTGSPELSSYSAKVNYVVDHYGPTDLNKLLHTRLGKVPVFFFELAVKKIVDLRTDLVRGLSGYDIKKDKRKTIAYFKTISPVTYASDGVPTLIVQGNKDKVVPVKQSKKLHRKLKRKNIQNSLLIVQDGIHGFGTTDKAYMDKLTDQMVDFITSQKK
ncbi:alpha/beta hydrolase [Chryseobacterium lathyri]|uniref:Acetyl esterase/lipase n=1 Tax=Chryseobacterium lathyri TaxID=395933 RepID=A0ABT9SNT1_9FLAO|nr:alpha/beta hydrolase [Chryseobacterium lathyri]MDP9960642.1 acetyl esterase/lipase [Chryseobacterium lathyri]